MTDPLAGPLPPGLGRDAMVAEVGAALTPLDEGAVAVVGVSGGPDSSALLALVADARPDLALVAVHVRHGLRDDAADVAAARRAAGFLGLTVEVREVRVGTAGGPEAAARDARWEALRASATDRGAASILVGHTADDQAETVLLNAARGAGLAGIAGMAAWRDDISGCRVGRPLLRLRRADVHAFVHDEGLPAVTDPTNLDPSIRRVRVRREVLPVLDDVAGDAVGALGRLAALAALDDVALQQAADDVLRDRAQAWGPGIAIPTDVVAAQPAAIARRVVRGLVNRVSGVHASAALTSAILALADGSERHEAGLKVSRGGGWLAAVAAGVSAPQRAVMDGTARLAWAQGTSLVLAEADGHGVGSGQLTLDVGAVTAPPLPDEPMAPPPGGRPERSTLLLPAGTGGLTVRRRRSGDRIATAVGHRLVADVMADAGVPRVLRDHVPVVEAQGRVVWVAGLDADVDVVRAGRGTPQRRLTLVADRGAPAAL